MVAQNYETALAYVLRHEGGYVNHPKDPGGATNKGVTQRVYDAYRRLKGLKTQSVRHITTAEVRDIYRTQYWDAVRGDDLPAGVDYMLFDYAVNSGPGRAIKDLQRSVRETADGIIGARTLDRVRGTNDLSGLIDKVLDRRQAFVRSLKTYSTFGRGWENRIKSVRLAAKQLLAGSYGVRMATLDTHTPPPPADGLSALEILEVQEAGKADPADAAPSRNGQVQAGAAAGVGALGSAVTDAANQLAPYQSVTPVLQYVFIALTLAGVGVGLYLTWQRLARGENG